MSKSLDSLKPLISLNDLNASKKMRHINKMRPKDTKRETDDGNSEESSDEENNEVTCDCVKSAKDKLHEVEGAFLSNREERYTAEKTSFTKDEDKKKIPCDPNSPGRRPEGNNKDGSKKSQDGSNGILKEAGLFVLKTAAISGAVIGGTAIALPLIGFGALGPIAGSLAAAYQSSVLGGTIVSGSVFSILQSVGMVGLSAAANTGIVAGSAAVSAGHSSFKIFRRNQKK